ncbi:phosphodiesterase [Flavobacterium davisii]|uniref:Phosphodiesterase n=1 Tax=Flavobacterium davisii TaxID=2906077 RepID=A0A246GJI5_9FLAO|nr:alkaline phosphatase D family protein [Flavobacterium davisii]OWP83794.1 phosphodiesterase [Flavobacterium davisii]
MKKIFSFFFLIQVFSLFAQREMLQSGPMVGYCEMTEAVIWLQTTTSANVKLEYFELANPAKKMFSEVYSTKKESGYTCHVILEKLEPGKKYGYQVYLDNKLIKLPYPTTFESKKLWQWREKAPDFTVAFGSCVYINQPEVDRPGKPYGSNYNVFTSIAAKKPDIMLWGGDNIYLREVDESLSGLYLRYTHTRSVKEIQPLLASTQNYAIWDDHDFGPNDGDRSFNYKIHTQKAFKDFWANKSYGLDVAQTQGIYSTFNWGDAQFFLLDNRFFKSPNDRKTGERTLLGKEQLEWLIDALSSSKATFKILVVGGQVLNSASKFENYATYPQEREYLLNEIAKNEIKGVLFLTGDRHFAELSMLKRGSNYALYDWTVSPLTSNPSNSGLKEDNKNRVEGSVFVQHNFGLLSFSGDKDDRQVKLSLFDHEGKELWNRVITKKELGY